MGAASFRSHSLSKVLIKLFHRAVRGSVLLKHSGYALRRLNVNIKVLVELFQKLAGFQRAAPFGRTPQSAKFPCFRSSAGVNPIKRSGGSFFGEGRPAIEGAPK